MRIKILILEDNRNTQLALTALIQSATDDKKKFKVEPIFVESIALFKQYFKIGEYAAVVLDNWVADGMALQCGLAEEVRKLDSKVVIAINSSDDFSELAERIGGINLGKDPDQFKLFLMRLKNEI